MNYSLVINPAIFKPYDYDLAWRAIDAYNAGYEKSLAVYDKIAQTLGDLSSAVEGSTRAKRIYDEYQNRFNVAADNFNRGMNQKTAAELGELRKLYGTLIRLLERANEARVKMADYLKALNKDNDYLHEDIGNLDLWMNDPNRLVRGYSGNRLTAEVASMMDNVAKSMRDLRDNGRLDAYNKEWIETGGFTPERINQAMQQLLSGGVDSVTDPIIKEVLKNVAASSGVGTWADPYTLQRSNEYMARGLYNGIGLSKIGLYNDEEARSELSLRNLLALEQAKKKLEMMDKLKGVGNGNDNLSGTIPINVVPTLSPNYESEGLLKVIESSMKTLGLRKNNDGTYSRQNVHIPTETRLDALMNNMYLPNENTNENRYISNLEVPLYHKNGKMMTKYQFVKQGKDKYEKKALLDYYENNVEGALLNLNLESADSLAKKGLVHTTLSILKGYKDAYSSTGSFEVGLIPIPMTDRDEILNNLITRFKKEDELPAGTIMRVNVWNSNGNVKLDKNVSVKELEGTEKPEFYSFIGGMDNEGHRTELSNYILFKKNGRTYAISKSKLGTIADDHYTYGDLYNYLLHNKDRYIKLRAEEIKNEYANYGILVDDKLAIGLATQDWQSGIENNGAAYVRAIGEALGYQYRSNPYDLHLNSSSGKIQP